MNRRFFLQGITSATLGLAKGDKGVSPRPRVNHFTSKFDDLFLTYWGHNVLYHNNGDGTFTDVTKNAGLYPEEIRWGTGCAFLDYNRDGWLDLFVTNYLDFDLKTAPLPGDPGCIFQGMD